MLFVCGKNRWRSPTAEQIFASLPAIEVASAGIDADADTVLTPELLAWADLVFVMERAHRSKLSQRFRSSLKHQRVVRLDIPDRYEYMSDHLQRLLKFRVRAYLRSENAARA